MLFKIILVVAPVTFINLNSPRTKTLTVIAVFIIPLYHCIFFAVKGTHCKGKLMAHIFEYNYSLNVTYPSREDLGKYESLPLIYVLMFLTFLGEIGSRIYMAVRNENQKESFSVEDLHEADGQSFVTSTNTNDGTRDGNSANIEQDYNQQNSALTLNPRNLTSTTQNPFAPRLR